MSEPVCLEVRGVPIIGVSVDSDLRAMAAQTPTVPDTVPDELLDVAAEADMVLRRFRAGH